MIRIKRPGRTINSRTKPNNETDTELQEQFFLCIDLTHWDQNSANLQIRCNAKYEIRNSLF